VHAGKNSERQLHVSRVVFIQISNALIPEVPELLGSLFILAQLPVLLEIVEVLALGGLVPGVSGRNLDSVPALACMADAAGDEDNFVLASTQLVLRVLADVETHILHREVTAIRLKHLLVAFNESTRFFIGEPDVSDKSRHVHLHS
jgi:hypothetical protein